MTTEIAVASNGTLALAGDQFEWTPVQQASFAHIGIEDAPDADKQVFHHVCQITGLDPFRRQIYMIGRNEKQADGKYRKKWTIQTGIDGFRVIAEDHPQYAGTLDPEWCGDDGVWRETWTDRRHPTMARVKVLRHDRAHPITLPVRFSEFAATYGNSGDLQGQWKTKPAHMIAKVAEAAALRKAFPRQLAGVYTDDEMAHVDNHSARTRGVVVEQDERPVTAAELTGAPPAAGWTDQQWTNAIDTAYEDNDAEQLRMLWKKSLAERPDDEDLRERISRVATALKGAAEAGPTPPEDVVDAAIVDEPDPPATPTADDADTVDGFWGQQDGDQK
jgi:phage recombination protein Bet